MAACVSLDGLGEAGISGLPHAAIGEGDLALACAQSRHRVALEYLRVGVVVEPEPVAKRTNVSMAPRAIPKALAATRAQLMAVTVRGL